MTLALALDLGVRIRRGQSGEPRWVITHQGVVQGGGRTMPEAIEGAWMVAKQAGWMESVTAAAGCPMALMS